MNKANRIRLGLPKGSLNTPGRGNTHELFLNAGYDIEGYTPSNESDRHLRIANDPEIELFLTRPQSAPIELSLGLLDIAVVGEDWVLEEAGLNVSVTKVGNLDYGQTRLVAAIPEEKKYESLTDFFMKKRHRKKPIRCFTEYVNLTRKFFMENPGYRSAFGDKAPYVRVRGIVQSQNQKVQIISSDGVTEGYIAKGADIIIDNTQSGLTLKEYGLKEIGQLMETCAGLYAGPSCVDWKKRKSEEIYTQLYGAQAGKQQFDVKFNVPNSNLEILKEQLIVAGLCSDEPTTSLRGESYTAVNILILREKYPLALRVLKEYGASAIVRDEIKQFIR
ncbi:MAG: ATP phosphoribosyltransferase [Candidatus Aenigmatarchaeota archaeon]